MVKVLCRFFEKKLRKKLSNRKGFWEFSKKVRSTVVSNRRAFFITPSGCAVWTLMALRPSLKVFGFAFSKKRMGFGSTPHKNGVFFLQSFFFCAFCAKRKSDVGLVVSLCLGFCYLFEKR